MGKKDEGITRTNGRYKVVGVGTRSTAEGVRSRPHGPVGRHMVTGAIRVMDL